MARRRGLIAGLIGAAVLAAGALAGTLRRFEIKESSMAPTLESGDWVFARRQSGPIHRGDIVVLDDPAGTGIKLVKRVVGVSGERMGIEHGRVTVNGVVLADHWAEGVTEPAGEWTVPDAHVWVLGDNRPLSRSDSRAFGSVPTDSIAWKVVARYWPSARLGIIS